MTLEGRSGPSLERVKRGIHVAIMEARTLRTRPLPYRKHAQSARTRSRPANRACHGGEFGVNFDVARTACGRFIRQHTPKLRVARTGHALAEPFRQSLKVVTAEVDHDVLCHQPSRQLMVSILASIANPLLDSGRQLDVVAALRLRQTPFRSLEFPRMLDYLPLRGRQQVGKSRVDTDHPRSDPFNLLRLGRDEQAQVQPEARFTIRPHLILPAGQSIL